MDGGKSTAAEADFEYDHDQLVSILKRHYQLLVDMAYLDTADVLWPPEAGWSDVQLNVEALRTLERNDAVIKLLRHIPYPRVDCTEIYYATWAKSYLREHWRPEEEHGPDWHKMPLNMLGLTTDEGPNPPHLIILTHQESEIGVLWVIDTERGCIYPHAQTYYLFGSKLPPEVEEKNWWWLGAKAMTYQAFFDTVHEEIRSLEIVPAPPAGNFGKNILGDRSWGYQAVKNLYLEYGWPDNFRKEEFLQAAVPARRDAIDLAARKYRAECEESDGQ